MKFVDNQKGEKILIALHVLIAVVLVAYVAMGVFGLYMLWDIQPTVMSRVTMILALAYTTLGLGFILSGAASWLMGWFDCGTIQNARWRDLRSFISGIIAALVGISCVTSAIAWVLEQ